MEAFNFQSLLIQDFWVKQKKKKNMNGKPDLGNKLQLFEKRRIKD